MKKVLRKSGTVLVSALVLFLLLVLGASLVARRTVSREALVRLAEEEINSRVEIGSAELSLFRLPARITLRDVALGPRDDEIERPPAERSPLREPPVVVDEVRLAVSLGALLQRRVEIKEFTFIGPTLKLLLFEDGGHSLDELLRPPGSRDNHRETSKKKKKKKKKKKRERDGERDRETEEPALNAESLNVYVHGFLGTLEDVRLEDGALDLVIEKTGMLVKVREMKAELGELEIDPADLARTNAATLELAGRIEVNSSKDPDVRYGELWLDGEAGALLFDQRSGDLDPELSARFILGENSYINSQVPVVKKAWRAVGKLERFGLELDDLPDRATFGRGRTLAVDYHRERLTMREPISVWFKDWELAVLEDSWIQLEEGTHAAGAELLADDALSAKLHRQIGRGVDLLPGELKPVLASELEKSWFRDGRLVAEVASTGEFEDPDVSLRNLLPDLAAIIKGAAGDLLPQLPGLAEDLLDRLGIGDGKDDRE